MSRSAVMRRFALVLAVMMGVLVFPWGGVLAAPTAANEDNQTTAAPPDMSFYQDIIDIRNKKMDEGIKTICNNFASMTPVVISSSGTDSIGNPVYYEASTKTIYLSRIPANTWIKINSGEYIIGDTADNRHDLKSNIRIEGIGKPTLKWQNSLAYYISSNTVIQGITFDGDDNKYDCRNIISSGGYYFFTITNDDTNIVIQDVEFKNIGVSTTGRQNSLINTSKTGNNIYIDKINIHDIIGSSGTGDIQVSMDTDISLRDITINNTKSTNPLRLDSNSSRNSKNSEILGPINLGTKRMYIINADNFDIYDDSQALKLTRGSDGISGYGTSDNSGRYVVIQDSLADDGNKPSFNNKTRLCYGDYAAASVLADNTNSFVYDTEDNSFVFSKDYTVGIAALHAKLTGVWGDHFVDPATGTSRTTLNVKLVYDAASGIIDGVDTSGISNTYDLNLIAVKDATDKINAINYYVNAGTTIKIGDNQTLYNFGFCYDNEWTRQATINTVGVSGLTVDNIEDNYQHCQFYITEPIVASITPTTQNMEPTAGSNLITIAGTNLKNAKAIEVIATNGGIIYASGTVILDSTNPDTKGTVSLNFPVNNTTSNIVYTLQIRITYANGDVVTLTSPTSNVTVRGRSVVSPTPTPTPTATSTPTTSPTPVVTITPEPSIPAGTPTPAPTAGWQQGTGTNGPSYTYQDGTLAKGWKKLTPTTGGTEKWYYFDEDGKAISGWLLNGKNSGGVGSPAGSERWYYLNEAAGGTTAKPAYSMAVGWNKVHWKGVDNWYYFKADGVMYTGWFKDGKNADGTDRWYYLKPNRKQDQPMGSMATGWQKVDGVWYYFADSGVMQTGWLKNGNSWYYLKPSGAMVANAWQQVGGKWYWFNSSGAMVTGTQTINGKTYRFDSSGAWIS